MIHTKGSNLNQSLSIVLPVHDAESTLAARITQLLELLPDLTVNFEVLIIDDGSSDQTEEVGLDLARQYPQVNVVRHPRKLGTAACVQTGLQMTRGEIIFFQEETDISPAHLRQLWEMRDDDQLLMARTEPEPSRLNSTLIQRLSAWGARLTRSSRPFGRGGVQMIRRQALDSLERDEQAAGSCEARHNLEAAHIIIPGPIPRHELAVRE